MAKTFHKQVLGANRMVQRNRGQMVTYSRGDASVQITAVESPKNYNATESSGLTITFHSHDWLIVATDLIPSGIYPPAVGDLIAVEDGEVHKVQMIPGRNCYDSGVDNITLRIHSNVVKQSTGA